MSANQELTLFARNTAHQIRYANRFGCSNRLAESIRRRIERIWDAGCHSDLLSAEDKERCRRCVVELEKMMNRT